MKVSINLPNEDIEFLNRAQLNNNVKSRSEMIHRAVDLMRKSEMRLDYENAWAEWDDDSENTIWTEVTNDGLDK